MTLKLGLDFGNVIKPNNCKSTFVRPEVVHGLTKLRKIFGSEIYIISRVSEHSHREYTDGWLRINQSQLQLDHRKVYFCFRREDKAPIAEGLGLTHFVDDRPEVIYHMTSVDHRFLMNPTQEDLLKNTMYDIVTHTLKAHNGHYPGTIQIVNNWKQATDAILETLC